MGIALEIAIVKRTRDRNPGERLTVGALRVSSRPSTSLCISISASHRGTLLISISVPTNRPFSSMRRRTMRTGFLWFNFLAGLLVFR